jgi:hypothetical protein
MKFRVSQTVTELPQRHGMVTLGFAIYWDFGQRPVTEKLYGTISIDFLIWSLIIGIRGGM